MNTNQHAAPMSGSDSHLRRDLWRLSPALLVAGVLATTAAQADRPQDVPDLMCQIEWYEGGEPLANPCCFRMSSEVNIVIEGWEPVVDCSGNDCVGSPDWLSVTLIDETLKCDQADFTNCSNNTITWTKSGIVPNDNAVAWFGLCGETPGTLTLTVTVHGGDATTDATWSWSVSSTETQTVHSDSGDDEDYVSTQSCTSANWYWGALDCSVENDPLHTCSSAQGWIYYCDGDEPEGRCRSTCVGCPQGSVCLDLETTISVTGTGKVENCDDVKAIINGCKLLDVPYDEVAILWAIAETLHDINGCGDEITCVELVA